jgi:hypothetical protein
MEIAYSAQRCNSAQPCLSTSWPSAVRAPRMSTGVKKKVSAEDLAVREHGKKTDKKSR